jgi:hypothetical protein
VLAARRESSREKDELAVAPDSILRPADYDDDRERFRILSAMQNTE